MRRTICFFLISGFLTIFISCFSLSEIRTSGKSGKFSYKKLENETISITHYSGDDEFVIIPENIDGFIVSRIDSFLKYEDKNKIKTITIPETVERIGNTAFGYSCRTLEKIILIDSNVNSLEKLLIFEGGKYNYVFTHIKPQIEILPERNIIENIFAFDNINIALHSIVNFSGMPYNLSFSTSLLYNENLIYGPVNYEHDFDNSPINNEIRNDIEIFRNNNNEIYIFIKYRKNYHNYYSVYINDIIIMNDANIEQINYINGNIFYIEDINGLKSLYKNKIKIFNGLPRLRQLLFDDNGINIAYITQENNNTYVLYLNSNEYYRTSPVYRSNIVQVKFSPDGNKLMFIERFITNEGNLYYVKINKKSFGPYRYLEDEQFSFDSQYFSFRYNNNQGWIEEKIEL